MNVEQFCTPKQLGDKLAEMGIRGIGYRRCVALVNDMRESGKYTVMSGNLVRPSEAFAFLEVNQNWKPFGKKK